MVSNTVSIAEIISKYRGGLLTPTEHISNQLKKLDELNKTPINAVSQFFNKTYILCKAEESSKRWKEGKPLSDIDGIPITIKDVYNTALKNIPIYNGSLLPSQHIFPLSSSPHVYILIKNGAIPICQTTAPELSFKGTTSTLKNGITRNPHNFQLTTGGSSGGAAALSACGIHGIHLGSDGGGSIRIPASCCGVIGLKPTYPIGSSCSGTHFPYLSCVGPICQYVDDCRIYMKLLMQNMTFLNNNGGINCNLIKGDVSKMNKMDFSLQYMKKGINGLRIGVIKTMDGIYADVIDENVWKHIIKSCDIMTKLGGLIEFVEPKLNKMDMKYNEAASILWGAAYMYSYPLDVVNNNNKHLIDPDLVQMMEWAKKEITVNKLIEAINTRDKVCEIMNKFMDKYDLLIVPTLPILPTKAMQYDMEYMDEKSQLLHVYTCLFNSTQFPAISINCGYQNNVPVGMQIIGALYKDDMVIRAAYAFEQATKLKISKL